MDTLLVGLSALVFCLGVTWELRILRRRLAALERLLIPPTHFGD